MTHKTRNRILLAILLAAAVIAICPKATAQTTYLVCVGLNDYDNGENPLPCSRNDANAIAEFYNDKGNAEVFMLLDKNATRDHILRVLKKQFAKAGPKDEIIFAYSGHGFDGGLSSYDSQNVVWCSEIQQIMQKSKAARKMMFIMACHSGTFRKKHNKQESRNYKSKNKNVLLFMSSRDDELSWENRMMKNSYFYDHLIKGLKGKADANDDKAVTARELFNYVSRGVQNDTDGKQHPVMYGKFADDLIIVRSEK